MKRKSKPSPNKYGNLGKMPKMSGGSASKKKMPMKQGQGGGKPGTPKMKAKPLQQKSKAGAGPGPLEKALTGGSFKQAAGGAKILEGRAADAVKGVGKKIKQGFDDTVDSAKKFGKGAKDLLDPIIEPGKYVK